LTPTQFHDFESNAAQPLLGAEETAEPGRRFTLSLFWRTFFLLSLLLLGSMLGWMQTLNSMQSEAHSMETAQELAAQVGLCRAALVHANAQERDKLLQFMRDEQGVSILPRTSADQYAPLGKEQGGQTVTDEVERRLGPGTLVAGSVNNRPGLWVSFAIDQTPYWLVTGHASFNPVGQTTWLLWLVVASAISLSGAALIARFINSPLKDLSQAASRVREGRFEVSRLNESVPTSEIRDVNIGFNRMAQELAKVEQDRAVMLAGISHDLRTPLARLRLETEMSVADADARAHMVADIVQLDSIIDKFLDYARPGKSEPDAILLNDVIDACIYAFKDKPDVELKLRLEPELLVHADEVELGRIISNLLENARRYGKSVDTGIARIDIAAVARDKWVLIKIRDHGIGVALDQLPYLTQPFYRGEAARTAANGAGLGLAIVEKTVRLMGGAFVITNAGTGGLSANIRLRLAQRNTSLSG